MHALAHGHVHFRIRLYAGVHFHERLLDEHLRTQESPQLHVC